MTGFASKRQAAWGKFSDPWLGINGWSNVMTKDDALKLALAALENTYSLRDDVIEAKAAIKEALAQPEQLMGDQINYGMSVTLGGKRIDPMSIYKEPEQDPVAMRYDFDGYGYKYIDNGSGSDWKTRIKEAEPVYPTPPKREWVGLTDDEIAKALGIKTHLLAAIRDARSIEAKLKEKNS